MNITILKVRMTDNTAESVNLYVLQCEDGCYYVGKTSKDVAERFKEHKMGCGAIWTVLHKPIKIVHESKGTVFMETALTHQYMSIYGKDKVRGGRYCQLELSKADRDSIDKELKSTSDMCHGCNLKGHFIRDCPSKKSAVEPKVVQQAMRATPVVQRAVPLARIASKAIASVATQARQAGSSRYRYSTYGRCYRCGRDSHYTPECYAKTDVDGRSL